MLNISSCNNNVDGDRAMIIRFDRYHLMKLPRFIMVAVQFGNESKAWCACPRRRRCLIKRNIYSNALEGGVRGGFGVVGECALSPEEL